MENKNLLWQTRNNQSDGFSTIQSIESYSAHLVPFFHASTSHEAAPSLPNGGVKPVLLQLPFVVSTPRESCWKQRPSGSSLFCLPNLLCQYREKANKCVQFFLNLGRHAKGMLHLEGVRDCTSSSLGSIYSLGQMCSLASLVTRPCQACV